MEDLVLVAKALGDVTRVRLLKMLEGRELCVCHITERLGLAQSTVSKHLGILRRAGLVSSRRDGHWVHYRVATEPANPHSLRFLGLVRELFNEDSQVLEDRAWRPTEDVCPNP